MYTGTNMEARIRMKSSKISKSDIRVKRRQLTIDIERRQIDHYDTSVQRKDSDCR